MIDNIAKAAEAERTLKREMKVSLPLRVPQQTVEAKYCLAYSTPESVNVTGSASTRTMLARDGVMIVDMVVSMPTVCNP